MALHTSGLAGGAIEPDHGTVCNVVAFFGAKGDGKALDSPATNKAIETAATAGGAMEPIKRSPAVRPPHWHGIPGP